MEAIILNGLDVEKLDDLLRSSQKQKDERKFDKCRNCNGCIGDYSRCIKQCSRCGKPLTGTK